MPANAHQIPVVRNLIEYAAIIAWWGTILALHGSGALSAPALSVLIVVGCWAKTAFFGSENMRQLFEAVRTNMPHYRFLMLMGVNTSQMILAFALDFHLLHRVDAASFVGMPDAATQPVLLFNFFYLSTLNFCFFGYSDILPQTVPSKIVNLTEIVLAFVTVMVLLSDFISLKESLRDRRPRDD